MYGPMGHLLLEKKKVWDDKIFTVEFDMDSSFQTLAQWTQERKK